MVFLDISSEPGDHNIKTTLSLVKGVCRKLIGEAKASVRQNNIKNLINAIEKSRHFVPKHVWAQFFCEGVLMLN